MNFRLNLQWKLILLFLVNLLITVTFINFVTKYAINKHFHQFCQLSDNGIPKCIQSQSGQQFLSSINTSLWGVSIFGALLALLLGYFFSRSFLKPFQSIITSAKKAGSGDYKTRISTKTHDETDQLIEALNEMYQSLQKTETLRKELVANMSHELSTPLTNIYGYLEALSDDVISNPTDKKKALELVKEETERLIQLIAELKKLAVLESENVQLSLAKTDINKLVKKACITFSHQLAKKKITLDLDLNQQLEKIMLDQDKIQQVISNLLDNAIKYSPSGSLIKIKTEKTETDHLEIAITDQGVGINKDDLLLIFERFFQVDRSRAHKDGIGIGLTIAQKIVAAHGGKLSVTSKLKKGSTFIISLPYQK